MCAYLKLVMSDYKKGQLVTTTTTTKQNNSVKKQNTYYFKHKYHVGPEFLMCLEPCLMFGCLIHALN